ncbi:MAG: hypothetical protein CW345_02950 [Firmicutes bacterium]|nr:hypothetical protein [Bacillota bacterium]
MNTLFARLLRSYVVVLFTAILVIGAALAYMYTESLFRAREQELIANGRRIAQIFQDSLLLFQPSILVRTRIEAIASTLGAEITVANREGLILTTLDESRAQRLRLSTSDVRTVLQEGTVVTRRGYEESVQEQVVTALVPIRAGQNVVGAVILHAPIRGTVAAIRAASRLLVVAALLAAGAGVAVSYVLSRRIVAPIREMTVAAAEMAQGNFQRRVENLGKGEVAALGTAFNELASRLGETIAALTSEKQKTESILSGMSEGVIAVDAAGRVILANPATSEIFGGPREWLDVSMAEDPQLSQLWPHFQRVLASGESTAAELHLDGRILSVNVAPLADPGGTPSGAVGILHDISERYKLEKMRRDFLANVSHELRTPLTSIRGFAQAILEGVVARPEQVRRYLQVIMDESLRLSRLVNTLLDLSRLESNAVSFAYEDVDLSASLASAVERLDPLASERDVEVRLSLAPLPPVKADRDWLAQVWLNLLENAIRHSPPGSQVHVRLERAGEPPAEKAVIDIEDEGPGIPEEEIPFIWERFYKVDKSRRYARGVGTGLGLVIVKELVERHGGQVRAENRPEGGARFRVELPLSRPAGQ